MWPGGKRDLPQLIGYLGTYVNMVCSRRRFFLS